MAVKTRAEIKADIALILADNEEHAITPAQFRGILTDIADSMFVSEDDYTYPAEVETLEITSTTLGLTVDGEKVVGERGETVTYVNESTTSDNEMAAAINLIISRLEDHGLITGNP